MLPALFVIGLGFGLAIPTLVGIVLAASPRDHEGATASVLLTTQQAAGAVGVGVTGVLLELLHSAHVGTAFGLTLLFNAGLFGVVGLVAQAFGHDN